MTKTKTKTKTKFDIKKHVTETIIAQIEAGTPPWRKPWTGDAGGARFPLRHTGEAYRGINILMLWAVAADRGYTSERWMTYKQSATLGGQVRKGEKAARSVFYGTYEKEVEGELEVPLRGFAKSNAVFNCDQIDGLPEEFYIRPEPTRDLGTEANPKLDAFFAATGAEIRTSDLPRAYFSPAEDHIHMPPIATFFDAARYYGVLGHETVHWVCGPKRLALQKANSSRKEYAFDELVAEIGACSSPSSWARPPPSIKARPISKAG